MNKQNPTLTEEEQKKICYEQALIKNALTSYTEELKKRIEGKRKEIVMGIVGTKQNNQGIQDRGYNQALNDIISELNHQ